MREIDDFPLIPSVFGTGEKLRVSGNFVQRRGLRKKRGFTIRKEIEREESPNRDEDRKEKRIELTV